MNRARSSLWCAILVPLVIFVPLLSTMYAGATGTRHGGGSEHFEKLLNSNFTIIAFNGHGCQEDVEQAKRVPAEGKRFMHIEGWWNATINNPLDIFYNETYRYMAMTAINYSRGLPIDGKQPKDIATFPADIIWGITLGDEEPAWLRYASIGDTLSPDIKKYNETYLLETGYEMKPLSETNRTEFWVFTEWLNEKSVWVYNFMHDYVKQLVPHALVFQYMIMPPAWGMGEDLGAAYELKADGFAMDCYYATHQPWLLYETVRAYRAALPDKTFHFDIWGTIWDFLNEAGDGLYYKEGSYERMRRETWISYLAGVDALGYFDWAPEYNNSYVWKAGHEREDIMGKRNWIYIDNLAGQLQLLPDFNPEPEVLAIGSGYQTGEAMLTLADLQLFTEYDRVNQRCFATTDIDLSNYSLVLLTDGWYYNSTVTKLNDYVASGGNLLFLGGIRASEEPLDEGKEFEIEHNVTEISFGNHIFFNISDSNILGLNLTFDRPYYWSYAIANESLSNDYTPLGNFYTVDEYSKYAEMEEYPLVMYHNASNPTSGYVLYFGAYDAIKLEGREPDKKPDLWNLYRPIVRAYADFLGITNSISREETEDMIITAAQVASETILAGVSNLRNENRSFTFAYDLSQLGFNSGQYWVHSLDRNESEGQYETNSPLLSFETSVEANGTRLFLISKTKPSPSYSIDVFPRIPSIADVNTTTTTTTMSTTTMTSTTTSSPSTTSEVINGNQTALLLTVGGIVGGSILVWVIVVLRKRTSQS